MPLLSAYSLVLSSLHISGHFSWFSNEHKERYCRFELGKRFFRFFAVVLMVSRGNNLSLPDNGEGYRVDNSFT
jgi:hypothetical protein